MKNNFIVMHVILFTNILMWEMVINNIGIPVLLLYELFLCFNTEYFTRIDQLK